MNLSSDNTELSPVVPNSKATDSLKTAPNIPEELELSSGFMKKLSNISLSKSFFGGLIFLGLAAIFFILTKGTQICLWSDCSTLPPVTGEFWAFAGGSATLIVLTTLVGMPLLPAVAISTGIWLLMQRFH